MRMCPSQFPGKSAECSPCEVDRRGRGRGGAALGTDVGAGSLAREGKARVRMRGAFLPVPQPREYER